MKHRVIFVVALAMILMVIWCVALAAEKTTNKNGAFVKVSYNCYDEAGNEHSPSISITDVEVNKTSANSAQVKIYYKTSCDQDSEHGVDRSSTPLKLSRLKRTYCTDEMDDFLMFSDSYDGSGATRSKTFVYAEIKGGSHTWENGKCKNCPKECDHSGNTNLPTCTQSAACSICGKTLEALGHDEKTIERLEPTCTEDGHVGGSYCDRCKAELTKPTVLEALGHDPITDPSVDPTCTETGLTAGEHCKVCKTILIEQQTIPALGHDYSAKKVASTCTEGGYTKHTCAVCGDSYKDQKVARLGHYYGLWHDNGDVTHTARCVREGCAHQATVECHMFEYALTNAAEEEATTIEFCPVCGFRKDLDAMAAVEGAKLVSGKLSKGEIIVREALLPEGGRLMTIAFEYAGKLVQPAERMEIALPIVLAEGEAFTLLNPDGTETAVECVSDAETTRVILEYPEEIDAERVDPETNLVRLLRAVPVVQ